MSWGDELDEAPRQYPEGRCTACKRPLSMYNQYEVCGPCRVTISTNITHDYAEDAPEKPDHWRDYEPRYELERFKKRKPIPRQIWIADVADEPITVEPAA